MITTQEVEGFYLIKNNGKIVMATSNKQFVERILNLEELLHYIEMINKELENEILNKLIKELR